MSILTRYLNRLFLVRLAVSAFGITAFAMLFDLLDASDDLLDTEGSVLMAFLDYMALRTPTLLSEILPIAALLAGLFTASEVMRSSELIVIWASGCSPMNVMLRLLPIGLLLFTLKIVNDDLGVPWSVQKLREWRIGAFAKDGFGIAEDNLWVQDGNTIIRLPLLGVGESVTDHLLIFRLDKEGNLVERVEARRAELAPGSWRLYDVLRSRVGKPKTDRLALWIFDNDIPLDKLRLVARPPQEVPLAGLVDIIVNDGYGVTTTHKHRTWLYHRLVGAVVPALMAMLGFAFSQKFSRRGGSAPLFVKGITIGFGFLIVSGMLTAIAEAGFLSPLVAAAGPVAVLALLVFGLPMRSGRHPRPSS